MQVFRNKMLSLTFSGMRSLYSASALGIDGFLNSKIATESQYKDIKTNFKEKMLEFSKPDNTSMIFTEDLKQMIYLSDENDLDVVKQMMIKFTNQNKNMRFGSFIFGPVVMRMFHSLNKPEDAFESFKALEDSGFFDQLISYQILMDLLLVNDLNQEVIEVFEVIKRKQLKGSPYHKNPVLLAFAACCKINTPDSHKYAKQLWSDLTKAGHVPRRRSGTFAAALALQQDEPEVALEILTSLVQQNYITIRNLKVSALAALGRPDDALPLFRTALISSDSQIEKKHAFFEEVIAKMKIALEKLGRTELTDDFSKLEDRLRSEKLITNESLSAVLFSEIVAFTSVSREERPYISQQSFQRRRYNFNRPGLEDLV